MVHEHFWLEATDQRLDLASVLECARPSSCVIGNQRILVVEGTDQSRDQGWPEAVRIGLNILCATAGAEPQAGVEAAR